MIDQAALQEAIGELWEVRDIQAGGFNINLEAPTNDERLHALLEKVQQVAASEHHLQLVQVDTYWRAAKVLLGPRKYKALQAMFAENHDELDDVTVALALLNPVVSSSPSVHVTATDALVEGTHELARRGAPTFELCKEAEHHAERDKWLLHTAISWIGHLPLDLHLEKVAEWETDEMFIARIKYTTSMIAKCLPKHPDDAADCIECIDRGGPG